MSKRDKEIKRLRREVEILRAQLKGVGGLPPEVPRSPLPPEALAKGGGEVGAGEATKKKEESSIPSEPSSSHVRADLRRSLIITATLTAAIGALALSQPHWPKIVSLAAKITPF